MNIWKSFLPFILGFTIITFSCNSHSGAGNESPAQKQNEESTKASENLQTETSNEIQSLQQSISNDTVRLEITSNDQMTFNKRALRTKAGTVVVLTLKHVGKMPKTAMGHNWVLLEQGVDMANFAQEAMKAKDNDYIPPGLTGDIIAHTKLLGGGESDTIIFNAPPIGNYTFLCSFPGHYVVMNGKFIVEKAVSTS